jgi:hypothetical protein
VVRAVACQVPATSEAGWAETGGTATASDAAMKMRMHLMEVLIRVMC